MTRAIVLAACFWLACGSSQPPKKVTIQACLDLANLALQQASTCEEARAALAKAVATAPDCLRLFGAQISQQDDAGILVPCTE